MAVLLHGVEACAVQLVEQDIRLHPLSRRDIQLLVELLRACVVSDGLNQPEDEEDILFCSCKDVCESRAIHR